MDLDQLAKDVKFCRESYKKQDNIWAELSSIKTEVLYIRKWLDAPHVCKWNGKIGELIEFKAGTPSYRQTIAESLKEFDKRINIVEDATLEIKKGSQILERIEANQAVEKTYREQRRLTRRDALLLLVAGGFITLVFGIVLDYVRGIV